MTKYTGKSLAVKEVGAEWRFSAVKVNCDNDYVPA